MKKPQRLRPDHFNALGDRLRDYFDQLTDERLQLLYNNLYKEGWHKFPPNPQRTVDAHLQIRRWLMETVSIEMIERREGRIPSIK